MTDLDGDGQTSPWEAKLCKLCLMAAITLAFGEQAISLIG